jgi:hypothetical protein
VSRLRSNCLLYFASLSWLVSNATAVDGVVLIDQARAMAGNVTPGDAPGFPVTITLTGSYKLSGNLTVPDGNTTAIDIRSSFVTIDLNGFSAPSIVLEVSPARERETEQVAAFLRGTRQ